jgi:hypothetical protein
MPPQQRQRLLYLLVKGFCFGGHDVFALDKKEERT